MRKRTVAIVAIASVLVASAAGISIAKATLGDSSTELPNEEAMENTLNLQESNEQGGSTNLQPSDQGGMPNYESNEQGESSGYEANEAGEG